MLCGIYYSPIIYLTLEIMLHLFLLWFSLSYYMDVKSGVRKKSKTSERFLSGHHHVTFGEKVEMKLHKFLLGVPLVTSMKTPER